MLFKKCLRLVDPVKIPAVDAEPKLPHGPPATGIPFPVQKRDRSLALDERSQVGKDAQVDGLSGQVLHQRPGAAIFFVQQTVFSQTVEDSLQFLFCRTLEGGNKCFRFRQEIQ
jgi:hypothetical protein